MMKKLNYILAMLWLFAAIGCQKDNGQLVLPVDVDFQVTFSETYNSQNAPGVVVKLTNVTSQQHYEATTAADGSVLFEALPAGTYDITASITFSKEEFYQFAGVYPDGDEITFNATATGITINQNSPIPALELKTGKIGDLVLKQIYFAGSDIKNGAIFRDQFIEIYNNSNDTIFLDGLYVMGAYGNNGYADEYLQANGQFDWQQAIGMPSEIAANTDYFYTRWLYRIPGNGEEYPLNPGEGIVIAQTALNHKAPFTDGEGETVEVGDPSLTVDLSQADFEVYLGDVISRPFKTDLDNPTVPNLEAIHIMGREFILDTRGRDSYVIFRSETPIEDFKRYPSPDDRIVDAETEMRIQVPKSMVIDAVEIQPAPTDQIPKKLTTDVDAGYTYVPGGKYSSQSVIRKTAKTFGERVVLQDSNNSTTDFTYKTKAEPGTFAN